VVEAVLLSGGSIGTAKQVAPHLGLHNRFELARFLKRERLPPLHDLAAWASVLAWVDLSERTGCSLCQLAFGARRDPAVCYRTVKRITGLNWHELKLKGLAWVVERFLAQCGAPTVSGHGDVVSPAHRPEPSFLRERPRRRSAKAPFSRR